MAQGKIEFAPGTLSRTVKQRTERAIRHGALRSIRTDQRFIEQGGVRFVVRSVSSFARRDRDRVSEAARAGTEGARGNPFLPYDPDLFVTGISATHLCLLNKFNVMDHHLLIVTRAFEHQETLLTLNDFEALWACMTEIGGLGFYNSGPVAGASQPHKHLQIVPVPIAGEGPAIPMEPLMETVGALDTIKDIPGLPFVHAFSRQEATVEALHQRYLGMLSLLGLTAGAPGGRDRAPKPYNLLVTREWMLLVPRSQEHFDSISINALGFAGSLFVRDEKQMEKIGRHGPMTVLRAVACGCD
jgi:ATP adenylyltransferase